MKNLIVLTVLSCIVLMAAPASYAGIDYETDFEDFTVGSIDGQDGWVEEVANGLITDTSSYVISGSQSLLVYRDTAVDAAVTKSFTADSIVDISFDAGSCAIDEKGTFRIKDSAGNVGAYVRFYNDGMIAAYDGETRMSLTAYEDFDTNQTSYHFRVVANATTQTYDFYVDTILLADDYDFLESTGSQLSELEIVRLTSSKMIVDNLVIIPEPVTKLLLALGAGLVFRRRRTW